MKTKVTYFKLENMIQNENNGAFLQLKVKAEHVFLK